jgi:hypothetical protein
LPIALPGIPRTPKDERDERYLGRLQEHGVRVHDVAADILLIPDSKPTDLHTLLFKLFPAPPTVRLVTTNFDAHFSTAAKTLHGDQVENFFAPASGPSRMTRAGGPVEQPNARRASLVFIHYFIPLSACLKTPESRRRLFKSWSVMTQRKWARYTPTLAGKLERASALPEIWMGRPSHESKTCVAKDTNQDILSSRMSLAEIIEKLPKPTPEERRKIYQQIETLDGAPKFEPTSEMLDAIEEGTRSVQTERMYTAEEIKERIRQWANSSFDWRPDNAAGVIVINRFWHGAGGTPPA